MSELASIDELLAKLNPRQREAATFGENPLLIVAGAGTGKTATLVHRVAWLIAQGKDPGRILLLTFTRRAASEMLHRADGLLRLFCHHGATRVWGGTYHAIATRLLRRHGKAIGVSPDFTVHDRTDSEDLLNVVRTELNLAKTDKRFPKKGTCMSIYSRCVNARQKLEKVLADHFPWCQEWNEELKKLFDGYVDRKEAAGVLDYDDLLLYWDALLADSEAGPAVRKQFDCVLVDEYQDTNALQADILYKLSPGGKGLTVVGDDAQSIYAFRAATVRNILDFPKHYPDATIIALEQNYRSTQPILDATNQIIAQAKERYTKNLWSQRHEGGRPILVNCEDEGDQAEYIIHTLLEHREAGVELRRQAILFRASHHSILLEAELARAGIPFHKYGGLKFVETAHVKDLMAFLRLAENSRDVVSGLRILPLLPGIGSGKSQQLMQMLHDSRGDFGCWESWKPPALAATLWPKFVHLLQGLVHSTDELPTQLNRVRKFYAPLMETKYDHVEPRLRDLEQLELLASRYRSRQQMLLEITLDPPNSTQDLAGPPVLDDDYLVLSTIHSAKGLEWDVVFVIHAADGNIPSDMATKNPQEIEEELRLFYVALTRAKNHLYICYPLRYYQSRFGDQHSYAQRTRFIPRSLLDYFEQRVSDEREEESDGTDDGENSENASGRTTSRSIRRQMKDLWG